MSPSRAFRHAGVLPAALLSLASLAGIAGTANAQATLAPVVGEQKTAVILVNFQDDTSQPITPAAANALVFGEVSDFYWETSYQRTFLSGDTYGWFTVSVSAATCDTPAIAREANAAAAAAGVDLSGYSHVVYQFPYRSVCGWSGSNNRGDRGENRVFVNGVRTFKVIAHELGHRFGLFHSDSLDCGTAVLGASCTQNSYGDQADAMGNRDAHFNAFQKERVGWFNAAGAPALTTVTASGRYTIEAYETKSAGVKALKLLKSVDPATGQKTWYYLEYRQPIGFDASLTDAGNLAQGLLIRTGTVASGGFATSLLLDATPASNSVNAYDVMDGALAVGRSFTDADAGVTISLVSADAAGAVVDVNLGGQVAQCIRTAPTLALSGSTAPVAAGTANTYTVTVSNRDSAACAATSFNLAGNVPAGWNGHLAATSVSIGAGTSASTTLTVTSPVAAAAGNYTVGVGAASGAGSVHTASASAVYSVAAASAGTLTETLGTDKASYVRGESVRMSARVLKDGTPVSGATVKFTISTPGGGTTTITATTASDGYGRATYKLGKGKSAIGAYQVRADASNAGASATASAAFDVR